MYCTAYLYCGYGLTNSSAAGRLLESTAKREEKIIKEIM